MQPDRTGLAEAGRLERALFAFGRARDRFAARLRRLVPKPVLPRPLRRPAQLLGWALTLRLPGELGYWLRARRSRGCAPRRFSLPASREPVVSVIVPTYGKVWLTLRCLASIAAFPPAAAVEVIVVDDASGDPALDRLRRVRGLRLLTTPRNLGFIGACNHAARFAQGEFLLFLNNDTLVRTGWLDSLLALLRARPDAGAAGSKLLYPTGRLQEAGGIIWRDATGANYGRGGDPYLPVYNYVREVDYCSGASLMVRRALFAELGGFDPHYAPAYYEDADLAFRLRARGHVTLYQPRSEVVHIEGASHGTDLRSGVKAHQTVNRHRFLARWKAVLNARHMPPDTRQMRARDHAAQRPIVLVVEHCAPEPDRDAGSQTVLAFLRALCAAGCVVKLWVEVVRPDRGYVMAVQDMGIEVIDGGLAAFETWMAENGREIDRVLLSRPEVAAAHLGIVRRHSPAPVAYYGHDLHFRRVRAQFALSGMAAHAGEAARLERLERWLWRATDRVLTPSEQEAVVARQLEPAARVVAVAPFCFRTFGASRASPPGARLLFVGGFAHTPNVDALAWFVTEILPLIRARVPAARLLAAGSHVPPRVWALSGPAVTIRPDVPPETLRRLYLSARVAVVPLRYGAGVKLKVVEALREGVPLVSTGVGAQGLPGLARVACVADDPARFADAACRLLNDDAAWQARCAAQIAYARAHFSEAVLRDGLLQALDLAPDGPRAMPVSASACLKGASTRPGSPAAAAPQCW
ncbi:MAG: glycosyltransferase [Acetobacteraceae bacterium]|nr:glycosyltransferase [Acetobacteraceae bacterium]